MSEQWWYWRLWVRTSRWHGWGSLVGIVSHWRCDVGRVFFFLSSLVRVLLAFSPLVCTLLAGRGILGHVFPEHSAP